MTRTTMMIIISSRRAAAKALGLEEIVVAAKCWLRSAKSTRRRWSAVAARAMRTESVTTMTTTMATRTRTLHKCWIIEMNLSAMHRAPVTTICSRLSKVAAAPVEHVATLSIRESGGCLSRSSTKHAAKVNDSHTLRHLRVRLPLFSLLILLLRHLLPPQQQQQW